MLLPADLDLVRRDTALPGLATLLDPDAFVAALRPSLPEACIERAQITYIRYKPGMNCLVAYQFEAAGGVVEVYAKAHGPDAKVKLRKAHKWSSVPGPLGPGRIVLEDRAIVVSIFPNDSKLRELPYLTDVEARRRLLHELVPDQPDLWEGTVQSLRYKPERRFVAQLITKDGVRAALKIYAETGYKKPLANAKVFESRGPLRLARLLGSLDRRRILAFEWLPGSLLIEAISDPKVEFEVVATVGAALAELHTQNPEGLAFLTREAETDILFELAAGLSFVCPQLARWTHDLARRLAAHLMQEPAVNQPIHGDFYAKQVLLADDNVAFLDFDRAVCSDPAADLGNFIAHLERDVLRGDLPPSHVELLKNALLEGYGLAANCPIPARVALYITAGLFRLAPDPFRYREPNWLERTEAILERAEAILKTVPRSTISTQMQQ